jgi:hypothetical protein
LKIYARTGNYGEDDTKDGIFGEDGLWEFLKKNFFAPEKYGYEKVDALNYYTQKLIKYNEDVKKTQDKYYESMTNIDKDLQRRLADGIDTRMGALFHVIKNEGAKALEEVTTSAKTATASASSRRPSLSKKTSIAELPPRPPSFSTTGPSAQSSSAAAAASTSGLPPLPRPSFRQQQESKSFVPQQHQQRFDNRSAAAAGPGALQPPPSHYQTPGKAQPPGTASPFKTTSIAKIFGGLPQFEDVLFGPTHQDYRSAYEEEMTFLRTQNQGEATTHSLEQRKPSLGHISVINPAQPPPEFLLQQQQAQQQLNASKSKDEFATSSTNKDEKSITVENLAAHNAKERRDTRSGSGVGGGSANSNPASLFNEPQPHPQPPQQPTTTFPVETFEPFSAGKERRDSSGSLKAEEKPTEGQQSLPPIEEEQTHDLLDLSHDVDEIVKATISDDNTSVAGSNAAPEVHPIVSSILDDETVQSWIKHSSLDNTVTEVREAASANARRGSSYLNMKDNAALQSKGSFLFGTSSSHHTQQQKKDVTSSSRESSSHGHGHGGGHGQTEDDQMNRAGLLSSLAKTILHRDSRSNVNLPETSTHSHRSFRSNSHDRYPGGGGGGNSRNPSSHGFQPFVPGEHQETGSRHSQQNIYPFQDNNNNNNNDQQRGDLEAQYEQDQYDQQQQQQQEQENEAANIANRDAYYQTTTGGFASILPVGMSDEQLQELTKLSIQRARILTERTKDVAKDAWQPLLEIERLIEMVTLGAYYKYSSTAFVTFRSRVTESIAQQMLLSPDAMEINHAPNPKDIIWENVAIPKSQIMLRKSITKLGVLVGCIFWSSLVNSVNTFALIFPLPPSQQQTMAAVVMLVLLLLLPFVFDYVARYYEGLKLESEIQNSIMTRYFYYQLINVYVTVGFSGGNLWGQLLQILEKPQTLVDIIGGRLPNVSLFFTNLIVVKIFVAIPLEMLRPWQLFTIFLMGNCMDRRSATRRDLRTGAFYSWPMLYGWIYPQLMMVLMIMVTYACITPLMMPFCAIFFAGAYLMYKYQLLYVYVNDYQSGGYMWYAVFNYSLIALEFASCTLIGK